MPLDREKFVKVLLRTTSDNDHEALTAIRMANRMLSEAKVGWGGLISGSRAKVDTRIDAPSFVRPAPSMSIGEALEYLIAVDSDEWIPLRTQWERRKQMSPHDQRRLFDRLYVVQSKEDDQRDIPE